MPTVLIVDDAAVDRRLAAGLVQADPFLDVEFAEHGLAALARIKDLRPDLVLTDLQMPEMDGLELVSAIRQDYPGLPVILMTAHGSEALAAEALHRGAASYVPKSRLAATLLSTVHQVLALSHSDQAYERMIESLIRTEFTLRLENDSSLFEPLIELVQQIMSAMGLCDPTELLRVGTALAEALLNAVYRGNLELNAAELPRAHPDAWNPQAREAVEQRRSALPYAGRRVWLEVRITPEAARFQIRDEGPGFDVSAGPAGNGQPPLAADRGKGLVLMRTFFDEVNFSSTGNEVTLVKHREKPADDHSCTRR